MKLLILLALAVALHAEDTAPTIEQLQAKVAEQARIIEQQGQTIAAMQGKINFWTQSAVMCEAGPRIQQLNAQIDAQAKASAQEKAAK